MMLSGPLSRIQLCSTQHAITICTCVLNGKYGLLARTLNRFFMVPNARSTVVQREECRRLNNSRVSGCLPPLYLFKWYRTPLYGGSIPGLAAYQHQLSNIYLQALEFHLIF
uniref:Uncharacterized protein n=1 Tax=Arundo donax TaxID=35708 RepID=A0A0A9EAK4_ARUDO